MSNTQAFFEILNTLKFQYFHYIYYQSALISHLFRLNHVNCVVSLNNKNLCVNYQEARLTQSYTYFIESHLDR